MHGHEPRQEGGGGKPVATSERGRWTRSTRSSATQAFSAGKNARVPSLDRGIIPVETEQPGTGTGGGSNCCSPEQFPSFEEPQQPPSLSRGHGPTRSYAIIQGDTDLCETPPPVSVAQARRQKARPRKALESFREMDNTDSATIERTIRGIMNGRPLLQIPRPSGSCAPPISSRVENGAVSLTLSDITRLSRGYPMTIDQVDWLLGTVSQHTSVQTKCVVFSARFTDYLKAMVADTGLESFVRYYHVGMYRLSKQVAHSDEDSESEGERETDSYSFLSMTNVLIPFAVMSERWCMALLQPALNRTVRVYDPCGSSGAARQAIESEATLLVTYAESQEAFETGKEPAPWCIEYAPCHCDPDTRDSGVQVCGYVRAILTGCDPGSVDRTTSKLMRMEISTLALELIVCGEEHD